MCESSKGCAMREPLRLHGVSTVYCSILRFTAFCPPGQTRVHLPRRSKFEISSQSRNPGSGDLVEFHKKLPPNIRGLFCLGAFLWECWKVDKGRAGTRLAAERAHQSAPAV